jgi:hypothetical protein
MTRVYHSAPSASKALPLKKCILFGPLDHCIRHGDDSLLAPFLLAKASSEEKNGNNLSPPGLLRLAQSNDLAAKCDRHVQFEDDFEAMDENDEQERVEKQQEDEQMSGQEDANGLGEIRTESTATMTAMRLKARNSFQW